MDISKLNPVLNKESILKTANAQELKENPENVLHRYHTYAQTHVPLGDTTKQLNDLRRVVVDNKTCAVGTIVGPFGYGKTSTAVHLWNEIREQKIIAIPPFVWTSLEELMDAVYYWMRFEFAQGPKNFLLPLEKAYERYRQSSILALNERLGSETLVRELIEEGRLNLELQAEDMVNFCATACEIAEQAGYRGMVVFTDELQVTLAKYPSRDQFFAHLFDIVRNILGTPGHWAMVLSMDEGTEGTIARLRADLLQRMQQSALYFRVKDIYNRREYPRELWSAFEKRFGFNGSAVILDETLESIGQVAAREDLGAGPRMVTYAMALGIKHYDRTNEPYTPIHFVDDFLAGLMVFDQRGKFATSVKKALDNPEVRASEINQQLVKLLGAYPMGCTEAVLGKYDLLAAFQSFPPLARRELIMQLSGGFILRSLAEEEAEVEHIEQRLTKEFVSRYAPNKTYAGYAANGFIQQVLIDPLFRGWKVEEGGIQSFQGVTYTCKSAVGTFDPKYPERVVHLMVAAVPQSPAPNFDKFHPDAEFEYRFELNYAIAPSEPSRMLVNSEKPRVLTFQLNIASVNAELANRQIHGYLFDYYSPDQITPLLCFSLIEYLHRNRGNLADDQSRISSVISPLRQFGLSILLGDSLAVENTEFSGGMVGLDRIKEVFRLQCRKLYPNYKTLSYNRNWQVNLQLYRYALDRLIHDDAISIARGRREWIISKTGAAETFHIVGKSLSKLDVLTNDLSDIGLLDRINYTGRQVSSEITLKLKMHPLESEWLRLLDNSTKQVMVDGNSVPGIAAEELLKNGKRQGYTDEEVQEVIRLLMARNFIGYDQRKSLIYRKIESIEVLKSSVQGILEHIESQIEALKDALPEFDYDQFPLNKTKKALELAKERDEIEQIRNTIREWQVRINSFIGSRTASLREKLTNEQTRLFDRVRDGIPGWLNFSFEPGPLQIALEKQRIIRVTAYQNALEEIKRTRDVSVRATQEVSGSSVEAITKLYDLLRDLTDKSNKLQRRIDSFKDEQEDMQAWREISKQVSLLDARVRSVRQVYDYNEFSLLADQLWKCVLDDFEKDPLSILSMHRTAREKITAFDRRVTDWVENRRTDFDAKCRRYQEVLERAGILIDLRVPFDQDHPSASLDALLDQVRSGLQRYLNVVTDLIAQETTIIRYAIQVLHLPMQAVEAQAHKAHEQIKVLHGNLTVERLREFETFQEKVVNPLMRLSEEEQVIAELVQQAVTQRPAEGTEIRLMDRLNNSSSNQRIDLRGLIIDLIENGEQAVDVDLLIKDIASLFKKNQISIHITPAKGDGVLN